MKKVFQIYSVFFLLTLVYQNTFAQKENIYLMKNDGTHVSTKDSADFVRIISQPDSGSNLFVLTEYFISGKIKRKGLTSSTQGNVLEGTVVSYYESGKKAQVANYKFGYMNGDIYNYYPNGRLYSATKVTHVEHYPYTQVLLNSCSDSTGKSSVIDGNGYFVYYNKSFKNVLEEGYVKQGLKEGNWHGKTLDSNEVTYTEKYEKGELISGNSVDKQGQSHKYTVRIIGPQAPKNDSFFDALIAKQKGKIELDVKNKILVNFYVEKNGSIANFTIKGDIDEQSRNELLAGFEKSTKQWKPGIEYGITRRVYLSLPYNFN